MTRPDELLLLPLMVLGEVKEKKSWKLECGVRVCCCNENSVGGLTTHNQIGSALNALLPPREHSSRLPLPL